MIKIRTESQKWFGRFEEKNLFFLPGISSFIQSIVYSLYLRNEYYNRPLTIDVAFKIYAFVTSQVSFISRWFNEYKGKSKGKVHPRTGHEGPKGE
jgi:hypothetical protein